MSASELSEWSLPELMQKSIKGKMSLLLTRYCISDNMSMEVNAGGVIVIDKAMWRLVVLRGKRSTMRLNAVVSAFNCEHCQWTKDVQKGGDGMNIAGKASSSVYRGGVLTKLSRWMRDKCL